MGITGGLVKIVFSRSCSLGAQVSSARSNAMERKKWESVKSYLCGSEFDSVLAEQDSGSVKSSEATVSQPVSETITDKDYSQFDATTVDMAQQRDIEEDAAVVIQTAFRDFLVRRQRRAVFELKGCEEETPSGMVTPSKESVATSIEVQPANSMEGFQIHEGSMSTVSRVKQKTQVYQVLKTKEEWDDSTVSSNVSKMRIRNRMEAMTRRERALAYASSQQLRISSTRKQARTSDRDQSISWSWLERWMATRRAPELSLTENTIDKEAEPNKRNGRFVKTKIRMVEEIIGEEKESCGSNDVSVHFDHQSQDAPEDNGLRLCKNKFKPPRSVLKKKTVLRHHLSNKVAKKDGPFERRDDKHMNKKLTAKKKSKQDIRPEFSCEITGSKSNHL